MNKLIYLSCNKNLVYYANYFNNIKKSENNETTEIENNNQNDFEVQEDKFIFSFLIQVNYQ